jgi:CxxC motif-containing protein (DUF1111 family)
MTALRAWVAAAALLLVAGGAASETLDFTQPEPGEAEPGGAATTHAPRNTSVFSQPSANMHFQRQIDFKVGDGIFRKLWVSAPASTKSSDGLGPLYNSRSCQNCHLKDGRGHPPAKGEAAVSMFLRLSIPPQTDEDREALASFRKAVIPEPTYGTQLQNFSIQGILAEGRMEITYEEVPVTLADGEVVNLRKPSYRAVELNYGPLHPETMLSPRVAPPMIGIGLLEAIPEADILALADPDDRDGDGISGRPNQAWSERRVVLGRFGWKAAEPTVALQVAHAFAGDMGLSTPLVPEAWGDCTAAQTDCRNAPDGRDAKEGVEVTKQMFDLVVFYSRNLAVPVRPKAGAPEVLAGKRVFHEAGCPACHHPSFTTRDDSIGPEQSAQKIWPYTDLLLHDMGDGLADNRPEGAANGREWRTAPLWGLGLIETVSGHTQLLHDGRARSILEAILWHGGEAEAAKQRVIRMSKRDREALLAFLRSL